MKIADMRFKSICSIDGEKIPVGTVFYADGYCSASPSLYLRFYRGVVLLEDPSTTWHTPLPEFRNYHPVDVEIVVKGNALPSK